MAQPELIFRAFSHGHYATDLHGISRPTWAGRLCVWPVCGPPIHAKRP